MMVGLPEIAANTDKSPGRVFTAPGTKATSAQSGEAPAGKWGGATSVNSASNISSGASTVPSTLMPFPLVLLLNQFAEDSLDLDIRVAGDAAGIGACAKFRIGSCVDLYLSVGESRRSGTNEGIGVSRRAAHPYLHRSLAGADLIRYRGEVERVAAGRVAPGRRQRAEDVEIVVAGIDIRDVDRKSHFPSLLCEAPKAVSSRESRRTRTSSAILIGGSGASRR